MEANVSHVYVSRPVQVARQAWQDFVLQDAGFQRPPENVHFIPAQGGCFVVALAPRAGPSLSFSWLPMRRQSSVCAVNARYLERFRQSLERSTSATTGRRLTARSAP
jgi:hypothetical protein